MEVVGRVVHSPGVDQEVAAHRTGEGLVLDLDPEKKKFDVHTLTHSQQTLRVK